MNNELAQDPELLKDFLVESRELLERMDQDMVALELAPADSDILNRIFRALHTIKGTSGFLGFDSIVQLSHRAEDVLNALRHGEVCLSQEMMDALLQTRDQLGRMLDDIDQGQMKEYSLEPLLKSLDAARQTAPETALRLGEILVAQKGIEPESLQATLKEQASAAEPQKLGAHLVDKGLASPAEIGNTLAGQKKCAENENASANQTMRVDVRKLDELVNLIGELVLERNRLSQLHRDSSAGHLSREVFDSAFAQSTARLSFITEELQTSGLRARMVPIDTVFRRFPRLVRDVARSLQKEVDLIVSGEDTEIDKTMIELIADPLVHLVRNSLDHGIEMPDVRSAAGKSRRGTIRLEASQQGDQILIRIADDGAGIDPDRVAQKALEKGFLTSEKLKSLSRKDLLDCIFLPGFSTAEKVNDLSGRGVGMDVVRTNLKKLNGVIELDSRIGSGTTVLLRLPLTLAILPVLLVKAGTEIYALPLRAVVETAHVHNGEIHSVEGHEVLRMRDETVPLLRIREILGTKDPVNGEDYKVVILTIDAKKVALLVDDLVSQESTVVKPLGVLLGHCASISGATIGGDGRVRLVLDPAGLLSCAERIPERGIA